MKRRLTSNIAVFARKTWEQEPGTRLSPGHCHYCHHSGSPCHCWAPIDSKLSLMTRWEVMQGVPGDSATIRLTMSRLNSSTETLMTCDPAPPVSRGWFVWHGVTTAWENADWLAHTRILSVKRCDVSMRRVPALFHVCILPGWWEIYEMQKLLKFRWLWLPARNCVRQGTGELKWPQMCIFIFGDIYILVGTEASRLGCWPIYHWNKWRKFHS